jgi:flap endonuclease-1
MGIQDLVTKILKPNAPSGFVCLPLYTFAGKRIAVDAHNLIYRMFSVHLRDEVMQTNLLKEEVNRRNIVEKWILSILDFGIKWLEYGCTPVFVFDGESRLEKSDTQKKRSEIKKASKEQAMKKMEEIKGKDWLEVSQEDIDQVKKYLKQDSTIHSEEFQELVQVLIQFGFPVITAHFDAEQMCASLCIEGKVEGVFSEDSDTLTFGSSLVLTEFDALGKQHPSKSESLVTTGACVLGMDLGLILKQLNMDYETFVDLCILLGCDYNTRIFKVGPKKVWNLIQMYGSIDTLPEEIDVSCLDHIKCRSIFEYLPSQVKGEELNMKSPNLMLDIFNKNHLEYKVRLDRITQCIHKLPTPQQPKLYRNPHLLNPMDS